MWYNTIVNAVARRPAVGYPASLPATGPPAGRVMQDEECAVSDTHHDHTGTDSLTIKVEPDDVPTGMLTKLALAVTIVIVGSVVFMNVMFDKVLADELVAKGYSSEAAVPVDHNGAKTWED
jgi:hypothetical protein